MAQRRERDIYSYVDKRKYLVINFLKNKINIQNRS